MSESAKLLYTYFKGTLVPLKMGDTVKVDPSAGIKKPTPGVDYKSVLASTTIEKSFKGKEMPSGVQTSETVHPGVITDGTLITVEGGRTINLGNFESARINVSITVPCSKNEVEETYEYASDWVSKKIEDAVKGVK